MKIAQVAPLYEAVPPPLYGGTERVVADLSDELLELGHDVTLFASGDSSTRATLVSGRPRAIRLDATSLKSDIAAHMNLLAMVREHADEFDVIHFHTELIHFTLFEATAHKTLTTLHGRLDLLDLPGAYRIWRAFPLVAISRSQQSALPDANWAGVVPHGLPTRRWARCGGGGGYLAFLGRMSPEKRPDRAIEIARRVGRPLKMAAKIDVADCAYFHEVIEPMLRNQNLVEFVGEIGESEKAEFLAGADALLFPIDWPEPFGLVMIEAMACGTPVIAFDHGSVPEVIDDGVSGFIVNSVEEGVAAVEALPRIDRQCVRRCFERRFSSTVMTQNYLEIYRSLCETPALRNGQRLRAPSHMRALEGVSLTSR